MTNTCKHPQVRVVARQDDVEFVECQSCREVFDAAEYLDMAIEEQELAGGGPPVSNATKAASRTKR